jgi:hypothetical protein
VHRTIGLAVGLLSGSIEWSPVLAIIAEERPCGMLLTEACASCDFGGTALFDELIRFALGGRAYTL